MAREHQIVSNLGTDLDPSLALELHRLREWRNQADYDLDLRLETIVEK